MFQILLMHIYKWYIFNQVLSFILIISKLLRFVKKLLHFIRNIILLIIKFASFFFDVRQILM